MFLATNCSHSWWGSVSIFWLAGDVTMWGGILPRADRWHHIVSMKLQKGRVWSSQKSLSMATLFKQGCLMLSYKWIFTYLAFKDSLACFSKNVMRFEELLPKTFSYRVFFWNVFYMGSQRKYFECLRSSAWDWIVKRFTYTLAQRWEP